MLCYAKSLQSCPTLCNPIDSSPTGSPVPGILQARTLEWVAISFSNAWEWKVKVKSLSRVQLLATPWTAAYQAPPSMGFSRQEYWSGVPLPSPENALVIANILFQWQKRRLYTWTSPHGQYQNQIDYIFCSWRCRSCIQSAKTRHGADCGSDHQSLIAKFWLKLKKTGKNNRPARYDLNQILYEFTVEVMNRFKGLDLIKCI